MDDQIGTVPLLSSGARPTVLEVRSRPQRQVSVGDYDDTQRVSRRRTVTLGFPLEQVLAFVVLVQEASADETSVLQLGQEPLDQPGGEPQPFGENLRRCVVQSRQEIQHLQVPPRDQDSPHDDLPRADADRTDRPTPRQAVPAEQAIAQRVAEAIKEEVGKHEAQSPQHHPDDPRHGDSLPRKEEVHPTHLSASR